MNNCRLACMFRARWGEPAFRQQAQACYWVRSPGFSRQGVTIKHGSKPLKPQRDGASDRLKPGVHALSALSGRKEAPT
jgi:hypothetical protein